MNDATELLRSENAHLNPTNEITYYSNQGYEPIYLAQQGISPATLTITFSHQGGILYVENGNLKYRGPSGTITTVAVD